MKAMAFGSCMSNLTIASLVSLYDFEQSHSIHHNRSDNFIKYYIDKTASMIPEEHIDQILVYNPSSEKQAKQFLQNQYENHIGFHDLAHKKSPGKSFFVDFREQKIDVILLDNFMDVAARLMKSKDPLYPDSPLFLNPGFYENRNDIESKFSWEPYLTPEESARNWVKIYRWLRGIQPESKIFFLPYHYCTSKSVPDRFRRIRDFYPVLKDASAGEDLHIIPPLSPPVHLTKGAEDWPHFQKPVYRGLAGYIYLHTIGGFESSSQLTINT
ncbi:hypothetical protein [Acidisoma sp. 7E03]